MIPALPATIVRGVELENYLDIPALSLFSHLLTFLPNS